MTQYKTVLKLRIFLFALVLSVGFVGLPAAQARTQRPAVPKDWVRLPENSVGPRYSVNSDAQDDELEGPSSDTGADDTVRPDGEPDGVIEPAPALSKAIGAIVVSTANTANRVLPDPIGSDEFFAQGHAAPYSSSLGNLDISTLANATRPADWVPWRLAYFSTQLSITTQGLVGLTTVRAQPSVVLNWRRQGVKPSGFSPTEDPATNSVAARSSSIVDSSGAQLPPESAGEVKVLDLSAPASEAEILAQFQPAIRAAIATGRIREPKAFADNTNRLLLDLREAAANLTDSTQNTWWIAGVRFDFSVDASGKILPIFSLSGEARFRFEWRRIMPRPTAPGFLVADENNDPLGATHSLARLPAMSSLAESLNRIGGMLVEDLEMVMASSPPPHGFQAQAFRVGLGISAKGEFGVAKVGSTAIAHLNFARDVTRPIVYPRLASRARVRRSSESAELLELELPLLDSEPTDEQLRFAEQSGILMERLEPTTLSWGRSQVLYRVSRSKFRKGLRKAIGMGYRLASATRVLSGRSTWKVYELKTGIDISMTGALGLATIGSIAAGEISFWNENF